MKLEATYSRNGFVIMPVSQNIGSNNNNFKLEFEW